jgi:hypothetical protein
MNEEDRASIDDLSNEVMRLSAEVTLLREAVCVLSDGLDRAVKVAIARG